jgi:predicted glycoside hydrolase/deacetylase ChbG (UPF0249 family)
MLTNAWRNTGFDAHSPDKIPRNMAPREGNAMSNSRTNERLGYPADARLLIVNADDFGMCHATNTATIRVLKEGLATSCSLMAPCPWALHALHLLKENPDLPFAVHLTLVSEPIHYRWGPLAPKEKVPSLLDGSGYFNDIDHVPGLLEQAQLDEVEREFRAQIEMVLAAGPQPTHLDWHCLRNGGWRDIFELTIELAHEYGLAVRVYDEAYIEQLQQQGYPTNDHPLLDSYSLDTADKAARYAQLLRTLPPGLSEWGVHPGVGDAEMQAVEPRSWQVRQTDFDFLVSQEAREIVQEEGIILLDYRALQAVWNRI